MKILAIVLALLLTAIQYPLWLGKGGVLRSIELERQLGAQRGTNERLQRRNGATEADVRDLRQGLDAIEERARTELGMIRQDEIFFQIIDSAPKPAR